MNYSEFSFEERSFIQIGLSQGLSRRAIGRQLNRSHTSIIREIQRNSLDGTYQACPNAGQWEISDDYGNLLKTNSWPGFHLAASSRNSLFKETNPG